jgi:hypothetical protein
MPSLTNVTFPPELAETLREAVDYYRFESVAAFFRLSGLVLIEHYEREESLAIPLHFNINGGKKSK